jgi:hypothetical protein
MFIYSKTGGHMITYLYSSYLRKLYGIPKWSGKFTGVTSGEFWRIILTRGVR